MNRFLGKAAVSILSESLQLLPNNKFVTEEKHFLAFEGTSTESESPLHSTFITRPRQDVNDSLFSFTTIMQRNQSAHIA